MTKSEKQSLVYIEPRNGAYFIEVSLNIATDVPDDERFDCASSKALARQVARGLAKAYGCTGPWEWVQVGRHVVLVGYAPQDS